MTACRECIRLQEAAELAQRCDWWAWHDDCLVLEQHKLDEHPLDVAAEQSISEKGKRNEQTDPRAVETLL